MKRKSKTPKTKAIEMAKKLVRSKKVCERCGQNKLDIQYHGAHIFHTNLSAVLAADPRNIMCLCAYCHRWGHRNPAQFVLDWFAKKYKKRYDELIIIKQTTKPIKDYQWEEIRQNLEREYNRLYGDN